MVKRLISFDDEAEDPGLPTPVVEKMDARFALKGEIPTDGGGEPVVPLVEPGALGVLRARIMERDAAPIVLVFAGSSTTQGGNVSPADRWVNRIAAKVTSSPVINGYDAAVAAVPFPSGLTFINMGRGGQNALNYIRVDQGEAATIGSWEPSLVMHSVGANDATAPWGTPEWVASEIEKKIIAIDDAATLPVAHIVMHQHERLPEGLQHPWDDFLPHLLEIEESRGNVSVFDATAYFKPLGIPGSDPLGMLETDLVHVNEKGHAYYGELIGGLLSLPYTPVGSLVQPIQVLFDDFERADGPLAGTSPTEGDQVWVNALGDWIIEGGKILPTTNSATALIDTGVRDLDMTVDYVKGSNNISLVLFSDGTIENMLTLEMSPTSFVVRRYVDGARSTVTSGGPGTEIDQTHKVKITVRGQEVACYVGGQELFTFTVEEHESLRTHHGFRGSVGDSFVDNLRVTTPAQA